MSTFISVAQRFNIYANPPLLIIGLIGSSILVLIFSKPIMYRKTPAIFFLLLASIHDAGALIVGLVPNILVALLNIDLNRSSVAWCKIRFFLATSIAPIPLSCTCLAVIDQFIITSDSARLRQWSSHKTARRASAITIIIWWLNGSLWLIYRDISPITGACVYINSQFTLYASIFIFGLLCGLHIVVMSIFSLLAYRNIRKTKILVRQKADRQTLLMVLIQIILIICCGTPYGLNVMYLFFTANSQKDENQKQVENFFSAITYTFCNVAYAVRTEQ